VRLSVVTVFVVALAAGAALTFAGRASASSCSFGLSTVGSFNGSISSNTKKVTQYTAVASNITKLTGYVSGGNVNGGPQHVRAVVYADSSGLPGARLAVSNEVNIAKNQAAGWVDFPLPAAVSISAGPIWMGYIGSSPNIGIPKYNGTGVAVRSNADTYSDGASDPFGTSTAGVVATYSLYASGTTTIYDAPVPRYGISGGYGAVTRSSAMQGFESDQVKRVGAKLFRIDYMGSWNGDHTGSVNAINTAISAGLEPELVIDDTVKGPGDPNPTSLTAAQYGNDCSEAATLYHNQVRYYEAMNEENSNGWTAAQYIPYLQACYNAVKAVDSRNLVLLGGLNPATTGTAVVTWVQDLYANLLGARPFDDMNIHLYGDPDPYVTQNWSSWCKTFGCNGVVSPSIYDVMVQNGDASRPIVATEAGWKANNPDEATQASIVTHELADTRVLQMYIYNMLADTSPNPDYGLEVQDPTGSIVAPDGTHWRRRPAFTSAQTAMGGTG
jgi:Cellulase (glycosyl hydrolase family 5)